MKKAISLKEIARLAHVSHPTVSRALKDSPLISQSTKDRIRKIASEYGYRPNRNARSLVTQRSNLIGCVVNDIADPFIGEVIRAAEQVAAEHDYSILLTNSGGDPECEMRAVRSLIERAIDGVIVIAALAGGVASPSFSERNIPIVLINNHHPGNLVHSIGVDNFLGARSIARHLIELGHRRIGYIGNRFGGQADKDRSRGYRAALQKENVPQRSELVIHAKSSLDGGFGGMQQLLSLRMRPTAVFCFDDITALGAYRAIRCANLRVSKDISIAGFDDLYFASYLDPPLTTISQPMREMGERAMRLLLDLLDPSVNRKKAKKTQTVIPGTLIIRESTSVPL